MTQRTFGAWLVFTLTASTLSAQANRLQPMAHKADIQALGIELESGAERETHLYITDYRTLYVVSTGRGPGDEHDGGRGDLHAFDVAASKRSPGRLTRQRLFTDFVVDGVKCKPDGLRADVDGNLWCASAAMTNVDYSGVTIWSPQGELIGRIRLPEGCANVCFGGPKRNRLFMAASQSIYALYTATQGASPG